MWRDGCFACKVDSATLLHWVADYRFPLNAETPSIFEGVSAFRGDGVIRMIQMIRIYRVQILKCASPYFRVRNLQMYRLQIRQKCRSRITEIQMVDYRWLRREVWRDGCFACKVDSATLLHWVADYRLTWSD